MQERTPFDHGSGSCLIRGDCKIVIRPFAALAGYLAAALVAGCGGESKMDRDGTSFAGVSAAGSSPNGSMAGNLAEAGAGDAVGGAGTGAGGAAGDGIVGCGTVVNDVPLIAPVVSSSPPPVPAGGTLARGTYQLSSLTFYLSGATCTPPNLRTSDVLIVHPQSEVAGVIEENTDQTSTGVTIKDSRATFEYAAANTGLALKYDCNGALSAFSRNAATPVSYTATASEIDTFGPNAPCGVSVSVFERR
jgi:hypothetical protein